MTIPYLSETKIVFPVSVPIAIQSAGLRQTQPEFDSDTVCAATYTCRAMQPTMFSGHVSLRVLLG
jgi:hypothetical protein